MPAVTLVVCVHLQRDLLERLLRESQGCYDELLVLHDTPDAENVRPVVEAAGGRFIEMPPAPFEELHWPFAWAQAKHDWIIKFDADEFPSKEMRAWLTSFRQAPGPPAEISGYTCIWPLWDGRKMVSKKWPAGRIFLFNKNQVHFFGMCEQLPLPDGRYEPLDFILHHQPKRKSYGLRNILIRGQSWRSARFIANSLLSKPTALNCWRWENETWPEHWEQVRRRPFRAVLSALGKGLLRGLRDQWRVERAFSTEAALTGPLHYALICFEFWRLRLRQIKTKIKPMTLERVDVENCNDRLQVVLHRARYDFVLSKLAAGQSVLEIGTGSGTFTRELFPRCRTYIGVEFDNEACVAARQKAGGKAEIVQADARNLPFNDKQFSFIVCLEVLEHLGDWRAGVKNIHRCLQPAGMAIISVPYRRIGGKSATNEYHVYEPGEGELIALFKQLFDTVEVHYQFFEETWLMTLARILHIRRLLGLSQIYADLSAGLPHATSRLHIGTKSGGMNTNLILVASNKK